MEAHAGNLGYLEWKVPLSLLNNSTQFEFMFYTWDKVADETVNEIDSSTTVTIIPEFSSVLVLLLLITATLLTVVRVKRHAILDQMYSREDINYEEAKNTLNTERIILSR